MRNVAIVLITTLTVLLLAAPLGTAGVKEAGASLVLPGTGQVINGEGGSLKTKVMGGIEVGAITTLAVLGGVVGGPVVWVGLGPLIGNHAWSDVDAFYRAKPEVTRYEQTLAEADRIIQESLRRQRLRERQ